MDLNFIKCGDYYVPDIKLAKPNIRLGKWGRMRKEYLRLAHPILFSDMVLSETLYEHCAEIEEAAKKRLEIIIPQLAKAYGVTEQLKAENQIEWVRQMNACVAQAEETIKLTKYEKETIVLFNEGEDTAHIQTYNAGLRNRLAAFSKKYPDLCRLEKTYEQGGVSYVLDKSRLSIRLQPPYSEERRRKASENAKQNGFVSQTE